MTTRFEDHILVGIIADRPAATAVPAGTLYSSTDESLVYQSDGAVWATWAVVAATGGGGTTWHHGSGVPEAPTGTSYATEVLADSPLLYLRMDETTGSACANSGSLGGNATAAGTYTRNVASKHAALGVGIDMGTSTGYATYPDTAALDITGDVTYECWVKFDATPSAGGWMLMSKGAAGGSAGYAVRVINSGEIAVMKAQTAFLIQIGGAWPLDAAWHHFAFTRVGNLYTIYLDGSSLGTATVSTTINATSEPFYIGADSGPGGMMDGKMDEVAVYNTGLSGARIAAHYAAYDDTATPGVDVGGDGDYYLNTATGDIYFNTAGTWAKIWDEP